MCNKLTKQQQQQFSKTIGSSLGHGGVDSQEGIFCILVFSDVKVVQRKSQEFSAAATLCKHKVFRRDFSLLHSSQDRPWIRPGAK
jgi:hypothetical protein